MDEINVKNGDTFKSGDKIQGTVKYLALGDSFVSYELEKLSRNPINERGDGKDGIDEQNNGQTILLTTFLILLIAFVIIIVFLYNKRKK